MTTLLHREEWSAYEVVQRLPVSQPPSTVFERELALYLSYRTAGGG